MISENDKEIERVQNDINSRWKYEIFGTVSRDELKKAAEEK